MRHSGINQREESFLTKSHLIENLLGDIYQLDDLMLFEPCLDDFLANLHVHKLLLVVFELNRINHLVNIVLNVGCVHGKQIFQRVGRILRIRVDLPIDLVFSSISPVYTVQIDLLLGRKQHVRLVNHVLFPI